MLGDLLSPRPTQPAAGGKVFVNWGRGEGWAVLFASCGGGNLGIFDGAGKVAGGGVWCAGYAVLLRPKCKRGSAGVATIRRSPASTALDRALCGRRRCSRWGFPGAAREVS
jgi:hypothetical protein